MGAVVHQVKDLVTQKTAWRHYGDSQTMIPWWAALNNRHNTRADIFYLGDSYVEGYPVSTWYNTIPGAMNYLLQQRFPVPGVTFGKCRGFVGIPSAALATTVPTVGAPAFGWTLTGGTKDDTSGYGGKYSAWFGSASGNKAVLTVTGEGVTSFDIQHIVGASGSSTGGYYKKDGGTAVPFSTLTGSTALATINVPGSVTNTIEVGWNAGNGVGLSGVVLYGGNENVGFAVHNMGIGGAKASTWLTHPTAGWPQALAALTPKIGFIQLGGNEMLQNIASATYQTNLTSLIALIRSVSVTCPIILSMTVNTVSATAEPLANYVAAARTVAAADSTLRVVEHAPRSPKAGDAVSPTYGMFYSGDNVHGNQNGNLYWHMAETNVRELTPQNA